MPKKIFTVTDERIFTVENTPLKMSDVIKDKWRDELEKIYICEGCKKHFKGLDVELKPFGDNFGFHNPMMPIRLVDVTAGCCIGVGDTGYLEKTHEYHTLNCPYCHRTHLFGMTSIDPRQVFEVK